MFQLLVNSKYDFMSKRNLCLALSGILCAASAVVIGLRGINLGIEFRGGTELHIKYAAAPALSEIRSALGRAGLDNFTVTTLGKPEDHEVYVRVGLGASGRGGSDDVIATVLDALKPEDLKDQRAAGILDINEADEHSLESKLAGAPEMTADKAATLAAGIVERRNEVALFHSVEDLADLPGMTPPVLDYLKKQAVAGPFALRSQSFIGPAIGRELMNKAMWAIVGSLAGMLIYIWIRFQFQWGLAAVVALSHDTLITLGLFSLMQKEMSLPVVAAFLTLIGYSVNDTVVVFDRIRENLRIKGSTMRLPELINLSINATLSRTIITSGLVWIVVLSLLLFGGESLNPFAFVLVVGVLVGTYSSIFIASPILVLWGQFKRRKSAGAAARPATRKARRKASSG